MDEQQYKATYKKINPERCVFEKAINSRVCNCSKAQRFNLADREGVACTSAQGLERCSFILAQLRTNARFVLQRIEVVQALGHSEEIKIQNGGLIGLQQNLDDSKVQRVEDIYGLISKVEARFDGLENLPFSELMQVISAYQIRARRKKSRSKP